MVDHLLWPENRADELLKPRQALHTGRHVAFKRLSSILLELDAIEAILSLL